MVEDPMDRENIILLCVTVIFGLCLIVPGIILVKAINAAGSREPAIFGRLGGGGNVVRILAIFMVIVAAFYLAVLNLLEQTLLAFLSAVAGFAFGGLEKSAQTPPPIGASTKDK
jgi:hypothetical protein